MSVPRHGWDGVIDGTKGVAAKGESKSFTASILGNAVFACDL